MLFIGRLLFPLSSDRSTEALCVETKGEANDVEFFFTLIEHYVFGVNEYFEWPDHKQETIFSMQKLIHTPSAERLKHIAMFKNPTRSMYFKILLALMAPDLTGWNKCVLIPRKNDICLNLEWTARVLLRKTQETDFPYQKLQSKICFVAFKNNVQIDESKMKQDLAHFMIQCAALYYLEKSRPNAR